MLSFIKFMELNRRYIKLYSFLSFMIIYHETISLYDAEYRNIACSNILKLD